MAQKFVVPHQRDKKSKMKMLMMQMLFFQLVSRRRLVHFHVHLTVSQMTYLININHTSNMSS